MNIVFIKPVKIEDCAKCANYIKENRVVIIDLSEIEPQKARRILDYISGATYIQDARIELAGSNVYCTIPNGVEFVKDNKNIEAPLSNEEDEISFNS